MHRSTLKRAAIMGAMVAALVAVPIQGATAESASPELAHCAIQIFPIGETDHEPAEEACFATEAEVAAFLAGESEPGEGSRAAAANVVVGTVYKDAGGAGASLAFYGASGCAGTSYGFPTVAETWAGSISSVRAANSCWSTAYASASYGGSRLSCSPYCSTLGGLNDSVRSLVFRPAGSNG